MTYELMITDAYKDDLDALPAAIKQKLNKTHQLLEENPRHPGLHTEEFEGVRRKQVFRSRVDLSYRLAWWYGDANRIVLWRVGGHAMIDDLDRADHFPQPSAPLRAEAETQTAQVAPEWMQPTDWEQAGTPIFGRFTLAQLRLLGVPETQVEAIRRVTDFQQVYDQGLPDYALINLESIYTNEDWSPENLFDTRHVFYRANAAKLEAYCAGRIKQLMLELHPDQQRLVGMQAGGPVLIKGVAGSGKTTIGIYHAIEMARRPDLFAGQRRVLFVTYTRTLKKVVQQLFTELCGEEMFDAHGQPKIEVVVLYDWLIDLLRASSCSKTLDPAKAEQCLNGAISDLRRDLPRDHPLRNVGTDFFQTEIAHVIKGRGLLTWEAYRAAKRIGRGKKLSTGILEQVEERDTLERPLDRPRPDGRLFEDDRRLIWQVYEHYEQRRRSAGVMDYADLAREVLTQVREGAMTLPLYSEIIVDEAQDLPPVDLQFISALAGGSASKSLTLLADPKQSIYYRGIPWKDGDIRIVSSRVFSLKRNFRNTRPILEAAWSLAQADPISGTMDEVIVPTTSSKPGKKPVLIGCPNFDHEVKCVKELVLRLCQQMDYRPGDIAVLARKNERGLQIRAALDQVGIPVVHFRDETFDIFENQVKAITINSAKGLEFPVVILVGINKGVIPRASLPSDPDRKAVELSTERNLLYVGLTRAAERLYITYTAAEKSPFLTDIGPEFVETKSYTDFVAPA